VHNRFIFMKLKNTIINFLDWKYKECFSFITSNAPIRNCRLFVWWTFWVTDMFWFGENVCELWHCSNITEFVSFCLKCSVITHLISKYLCMILILLFMSKENNPSTYLGRWRLFKCDVSSLFIIYIIQRICFLLLVCIWYIYIYIPNFHSNI